jgi:hypothetical protein
MLGRPVHRLYRAVVNAGVKDLLVDPEFVDRAQTGGGLGVEAGFQAEHRPAGVEGPPPDPVRKAELRPTPV